MRNNFFDKLFESFKFNENIFLLTADIGYSVLEKFKEYDNKRFINVGIAEQNMIGIASGLAHEGKILYVYSIGNFPSLRCLEQIRYDIAYHNKNVKVVSVGAGFAYGQLGASHHATEDVSIMRSIPNILVCNPADRFEAKRICEISLKLNKPMYIRLNKSNEPDVHSNELPTMNPGDIMKIRSSKNKNTILTTGQITEKVNKDIINNNLDCSLYSFPFLSDINQDEIINIFETSKKIITIEEGQLNGGFGSLILEIVNDLYDQGKIKKIPKIKRVGINNKFTYICGTQEYLRKVNDLAVSSLWFNE